MNATDTSSKVKLINYSQMVDETQKNMSLIDQIAYFARVSNPNNQSNTATSERLCLYLINNKHFSPFEMVHICLEINTTRDIARQILRHRSFSFQEFSQRYAVADLGYEYKEARLQDNKNRQNSTEFENEELKTEWYKQQKKIGELSKKTYNWALEHGIAKEQARAVLPEGMTLSRMYMSGNLRSWIHYIKLRTANGTQKEHRQIAFECAYVIKEIFPFIQLYLV